MSLHEPGACLSLWPTEQCEWSTWDVWRSSDLVERAIYLGLVFMLAHTIWVLIRFLRRSYSFRQEIRDFKTESGTLHIRNRKRLIGDLSQGFGTLKATASAAPFLALAGTSYGILAALSFGYSGSRGGYVELLFGRIAFALTTTLAGILVAILAGACYNLLRGRVEDLGITRFSTRHTSIGETGCCRFAQGLPLRSRFSILPPFAVVAVPTLACVVCLFMPFHPYRVPKGLRVLLPSFPCQPELLSDRIIVLRVTESGDLFINTEAASWTDLPHRLSEIYKTRTRRDLYVRSDDRVSFQTVADAIDTATKIRTPEFNSINLNVLLITPQAETDSEKCFAVSVDRSGRQFLRK